MHQISEVSIILAMMWQTALAQFLPDAAYRFYVYREEESHKRKGTDVAKKTTRRRRERISRVSIMYKIARAKMSGGAINTCL